jgi:hypothetical protein
MFRNGDGMRSCLGVLSLGVLLLVGSVSCRSGAEAEASGLELPVPSFGRGVERAKLPDGRTQVSFEVDDVGRSDRAVGFYDEWAEGAGWRRVRSDEESWASDDWRSVSGPQGNRVGQFFAHWQSPDGGRSLRVIVVAPEDDGRQSVVLLESPFYLLE